MTDPRWGIPCESDARWGERVASKAQIQRCECNCWLAAIWIVASGPGGFYMEDLSGASCASDPGMGVAGYRQVDCHPPSGDFHCVWTDGGGTPVLLASLISIQISVRSSSPLGTSISIPIKTNYLYDTTGCYGSEDPSVFGTLDTTLPLIVGADTGGAWVLRHTWTQDGVTFRAYVNSYTPRKPLASDPATPLAPANPPTHPPYCEWSSEYGIPLPWDADDQDGTGHIPGPVKWRTAIATLIAGFSGDALHPHVTRTPPPGSGFDTIGYPISYSPRYMIGSDFGFNGYYDAFTDPPVTAVPDGSFGDLNVGNSGKFESFNRWVFSDALGPFTTDDTFDLTVQTYNPYTGNVVDGSHTVVTDSEEVDVDTPPEIELNDLLDVDELISHGSITRTSFGLYVIHGCKFYCQAGTRHFSVYPKLLSSGHSVTSQPRSRSAAVTVNPGAKAYVDLPPWDPAFDTLYFRVGETVLFPGGLHVKARILDSNGLSDVWNVVPSATDSITLILTDGGGNAWSSGVLNGTNPKAAVAGIVDWSDLSVTHALGNNYGIALKNPPGTGLSRSFNANRHEFPIALTTGLKFQGTPITVAHGVDFDIKVDLVDFSASLINPTTQDALTLSGAGSFTGFGTVTPSGGTATFHGHFPSAGTYVVQVVTSGVTYKGPGLTYGTPPTLDPAITITVVVT